jgi:hypothetical protein
VDEVQRIGQLESAHLRELAWQSVWRGSFVTTRDDLVSRDSETQDTRGHVATGVIDDVAS